MLLEKKMLGVEEIEAQTALELPDRQMMALVQGGLVNVNVGPVSVDLTNVDVLSNNNVAVCANVIAANSPISCTAG